MQGNNQGKNEEKTYIRSKKKWEDFKIHDNIISALKEQNKLKPTRVQEETLEFIKNPDRKKFNLLIRAVNGAGKTLAFLLPILNSLQPNSITAEDKKWKGKEMKNEIFRPQGLIIVQTNLLQEQIQKQLQFFRDYGKKQNLEKLNFTIGRMDKQKHQHGDIIVCMSKSFLNRHSRGNFKFDNCKFVALDEVDDIYQQDRDQLHQILTILSKQRPNILTCSATMKRQFMKFYSDCCPDYQRLNMNEQVQKQTGQKVTLQGVSNYYKQFEGKIQMHKFVIMELFKQLYNKQRTIKPQVFIFFNSTQEIDQFDKYFQSVAKDFTTQESQYLAGVSRVTLAGKTIKDGKKTDTTISQKKQIITKFRNKQVNILLATNIIARGIDVRNACFAINMGAPRKTQREESVQVDLYLHRVGRTGRHNDIGVALTLVYPNEKKPLIDGVSKFHKIDIKEMETAKKIADEVFNCMKANSI